MKAEENMNNDFDILAKLRMLHSAADEQVGLIRLEYLFYTDSDIKGEELAEDLMKLNYEAEVDATHRKCDATRVFGTTTWLNNDEATIDAWYSEMRDIGNEHGCDIICYSEVKSPEIELQEILGSTVVVNPGKFEARRAAQISGLEIFRELYHLHGGGSDFMRLDYWFYSANREKAKALAEELTKMAYEVEVSSETTSDGRISITGRTAFMKDDDSAMENWVNRMNELGFIHDCEFDGWGAPCEDEGVKGGWFSDDTPEEELRKRLGMPPLDSDQE